MAKYDNSYHCSDCSELCDDVDNIEKCPNGAFDHNVDKDFFVPVTWEACGYVKVRAGSAAEACYKLHENPDHYPLPKSSEYVDASFGLSGDVEEAIVMCEAYTADYEAGKIREE